MSAADVRPADDAGEVHHPTTPVQCACGWRQTDPGAGSWQNHMSDEARAEADRLRAEVERLRTRRGDCICDYNPSTTDGPSEDCPQHGRPYSYWVERSDAKEAAFTKANAEADRLRATLAAVAEVVRTAGVKRASAGGAYYETITVAQVQAALSAADPVSLADVRVVDRVANLLCERHQVASPTRQPCAACVQDAYAATGADPLWMSPAADPVSLADVREPTDKQVMDAFGEMG